MEWDSGKGALVGFEERVKLEVLGEYLGLAQESALDDLGLFELLVRSNDVEAGVKLVGELDSLFLCEVLGFCHVLHGCVERVGGGCQALDVYIGLCELAAEPLDCAFLVGDLLFQRLDGALKGLVIAVGGVEFLLKLGEPVAALLQCLLDCHHVVADLLAAVLRFGGQVVGRGEYVLELLDLRHTLGNIVHEVEERVLVGQGHLQGVGGGGVVAGALVGVLL